MTGKAYADLIRYPARATLGHADASPWDDEL